MYSINYVSYKSYARFSFYKEPYALLWAW